MIQAISIFVNYCFRYQPIVLDSEQFVVTELSQAMGKFNKKAHSLLQSGFKMSSFGLKYVLF